MSVFLYNTGGVYAKIKQINNLNNKIENDSELRLASQAVSGLLRQVSSGGLVLDSQTGLDGGHIARCRVTDHD